MRILLVDDEEQVLKGVTRIIGCEEDEWEVETALSGELALEILAQAHFDAVVSDMRMPGMDGAQLLDEIGNKYPAMLRVVLSGQVDRETVLRAVKPMHQYLSKPCEPGKLIEVIKRAEIFQQTIKSATVLDAIGRAGCMPAFPEVVNEINCEIESEDGTSKSIADVIAKDPVLTARILQLANSSIFAQRSTVAEIDRAVSWVGLDMVRSLAMSQAVYPKDDTSDNIVFAKQLLEHGFAVAISGRKLARHAKYSVDDCNVVFSAGLLHDVGKLILLNAFTDEYKAVVNESKNSNRKVEELEMEAFGASHQGIGGYLFGLWGLPAEVTESVASHHSLSACAQAVGKPRQIVFAANWIARHENEEDLEPLINECSDVMAAQTFVRQISDWREYLASTEVGE